MRNSRGEHSSLVVGGWWLCELRPEIRDLQARANAYATVASALAVCGL